MSKRWFTYLTMTAVLAGAGTVWPQSTLPPTEELDRVLRRAQIKLDRHDRDLAHDYQDLLEQLETVLLDYDRYFGELEGDQADVCRGALFEMIMHFERGDYYIDAQLLLDDISKIESRLLDRERDLRGTDHREMYRLVRSLRREIELIDDMAHEEIFVDDKRLERLALIQAWLLLERDGENDEAQARRESIERRVEQRLHEHVQKIEAGVQKSETQIQKREAIAQRLEEMKQRIEEYKQRLMVCIPDEESVAEIVDLIEDLNVEILIELNDSLMYLEAPTAPPTPNVEIIEVSPEVPMPRIVIHEKDRTFVRASGEAGRVKEYVDSVAVRDSDLPVYVNNHFGRLRVTGWDEDQVKISFDVEVAAESSQKAEEFIDEIEVKLFTNSRGVYITTHFPDIADPKRQVVASFMDVRVPSVNRLVCDNSFGSIEISGMEEGVRANAKNCSLELSDIEGGVQAVTTAGPTTIRGCSDRINVRGSLGSVRISDCDADMEVENSYASIRIMNCDGEAVIRNSGEINLNDHDGDIEIENSGGTTTVREMTGLLRIRTSMKSISLADIDGRVEIEATSADIDAHDITGELTATSHAGDLVLKRLEGAFHIDVIEGDVHITLKDPVEGASSITAYGGDVTMKLSDDSDIKLTAVTEGGAINGAFSKNVTRDRQTSNAVVSFGSGSIPLDVRGHGTVITILDAH